jgi:hypothetical protein
VNEKEQKHLVFCTRENRKLQVLSNKFRDSNMLEHLIEQYHTRAFIYSFFLRKFGGENFSPTSSNGGNRSALCTLCELSSTPFTSIIYNHDDSMGSTIGASLATTE